MSDPVTPAAPEPMEWACVRVAHDLSQVGPAVEILRDWLRARGAGTDETLAELELAVTEALTNSIRHGGGGAADFITRLAWSWRRGELEIEISEPGLYEPAANWDKLPEDPLSEGGRGGFLITELMDAVEHRNVGGRHALRLRRRLAHRADATISATEAALQAMTEDLGNAYETIAALFGLSEDLATAAELGAMARKSLARLRPLLGADAAWVRLASPDGTLRRLASDGRALGPDDLDLDGGAIEPVVARAGVERTLENRAALPPDDPLHAPGGCAFVCPFSFEGKLRGVLTVKRAVGATSFFSAGQIALARTLADFLGIACANADLQTQRRAQEQAQRELEIAARIQRALLPQTISEHPGWEVAGVCAQAAEVGGDFFDVIDRADGSRLIVIADVMGKGVPAALMAATLRTALRALATNSEGPGELLTRVNRQLCADLGSIDMFITAQIVWLETGGDAVRFANAGHCSPLLFAPEPAAAVKWWDEVGGLPIGVSSRELYDEARHQVPEGARGWLMTDGALETENARGEQLGTDGFALLARGAGDPAALLSALEARASEHAASDDCTLIHFKRRATAPA
jgi:serine phosphatase RsbU (regulator of sigma subunit)/anti-sigma regulatory factor (Ser/Thr protein kinase)